MFPSVHSLGEKYTVGLILIKIRSIDAPVVTPFSFQTNTRVGTRTSLICSVSVGSHPLEFRWTRNGKPIESRNIEVANLKSSSMINFDPITSEDGGEYKCTVKNSVGTAFHSCY